MSAERLSWLVFLVLRRNQGPVGKGASEVSRSSAMGARVGAGGTQVVVDAGLHALGRLVDRRRGSGRRCRQRLRGVRGVVNRGPLAHKGSRMSAAVRCVAVCLVGVSESVAGRAEAPRISGWDSDCRAASRVLVGVALPVPAVRVAGWIAGRSSIRFARWFRLVAARWRSGRLSSSVSSRLRGRGGDASHRVGACC